MSFSSGWLPHSRLAPLISITIWASFAAHVSAQQPPKNAGPDPVESFCMRWWSQCQKHLPNMVFCTDEALAVVKHDTLYIDSGIQRFNDSGDVYLGISRSQCPHCMLNCLTCLDNYLLSINMTQTWNWQVPSNETGSLVIDVKPKNVTSPSTGTAIPNLIRGHLFHGPQNKSDTIYNFGGATYMNNQSFEGYRQPDSSQYPLWTYDRTLDSPWDKHTIQQVWQPNHGAAAEDTDRGVGFYLGGQIDMGTSTLTLDKPFKDPTQNLYMPLDGMLIISLVDLDVRADNISTSSMKQNTPRVGGTLEYIDAVGDGGILVALGGQIQPGLKFGEIANRTQGQLVSRTPIDTFHAANLLQIDFSKVDVFDLDSYFGDTSSNGTWYEQTTDGHIPAPRIDFCTVYVSAPDNSSHHIYLYSGFDPINNIAYDDVFVLSIPSFTWTSLFDHGGGPRIGHNCHLVGKRQMITIGGNVTTLPCDWELKGVAFLELSTIAWGSTFLSNITDTDYDVPNQLLSVTGGKATGGATAGAPKQGWTEEPLAEVFRKSRYTIPPTWTTSQTSKKSNVGAIAGGVVGGVAVLAILATTRIVLRRRCAKAKQPTELHSDDVLHRTSSSEKFKHELQGVNENDPAELPGPEAQELNAPRTFVEADHDTAAWAAELSGTNTVAGGVLGVPTVRTPGDDLPERPQYTPGLRRASDGRRRRSRSRSSSRSSSTSSGRGETVGEGFVPQERYKGNAGSDKHIAVSEAKPRDSKSGGDTSTTLPETDVTTAEKASASQTHDVSPQGVSTKPTEAPTPPGTAL